jgi:general secretion pathway protein A
MYTDFYGLRELPFSLTPDPRFLYFTPSHKEVLANLRYGITNGKGLIVVTGEVGTGKTTIVRWMLEHFDRTVLVAYIFNPRLTVNEFYQHVAQLLNIQNWSTKSDLMLELGRTLEARSARGLRTVLIIDEAQGLAPFVLEEIRLLMNFESNTAKFLQIILTGQPELREVLNSQELRQLKQRIALRSEIQPLPNVSETENYILERLRVAGAKEPNIFSPEAIDFIFRCSEGIPRQVNNLCDNAMLLGYGAELPIIGRKVIEEVAETFDMLPRLERSVLEAHYDQPVIFTHEARQRMTEERVEMPARKIVTETAPPRPVPAPVDDPLSLPTPAVTPNLVRQPLVAPPSRPLVASQPSNGQAAPQPRPTGNGAAIRPPAVNGNGMAKPAPALNGNGAAIRPQSPNGNGAAVRPLSANGNGAAVRPPSPNGNGAAIRPPVTQGNGMPAPRPAAPVNGAQPQRLAPSVTAPIRPPVPGGGNGAGIRPEPAATPSPAARPRERVGKRR